MPREIQGALGVVVTRETGVPGVPWRAQGVPGEVGGGEGRPWVEGSGPKDARGELIGARGNVHKGEDRLGGPGRVQGARGRGVTLMGIWPGPRCHIITQFNRGIYDYIVATDEELPAAPIEQPPRKKRKGAAPRWVPPGC